MGQNRLFDDLRKRPKTPAGILIRWAVIVLGTTLAFSFFWAVLVVLKTD